MPNDIWQHCPNSCYNPVTRNQLDCCPPIHICPSLSHCARSTPLLCLSFFRACCNSKSFLLEPPAASVLSESFLWAQKKKKSVQTSSQLASSCWSQEKKEGDRQTLTTTTLATENKSIQLIVCADVKVCVCECKSLINTIFYNCSVIYVCVCVSVSVSVDWMQHWKNNRNWEKIQKKKKRNTAATTTRITSDSSNAVSLLR